MDEAIIYLSNTDKTIGALIKLFPEREHVIFTEAMNVQLKIAFSNIVLFPLSLGVSETDSQTLKEALIQSIKNNLLIGVLRYMLRGTIKPEDFCRLNTEEKKMVKDYWNSYVINTKEYLQHYNIAKQIYDELMHEW